MEREQRMEQLPPVPVRLAGKALVRAVARWPWAWRLLSKPTRRFFDSAAEGWDQRVDPDSAEHLAPLAAAFDALNAEPAHVLEVGTGTGAGGLMIARRYPAARVAGVDISARMIERARTKRPDDLAERVEFAVADAAALPYDDKAFDLVVLVNAPVFFGEIARVLAPGGHVVVVASLGTHTPFHTPHATLTRGFRRVGVEPAGEGQAGDGLYYTARVAGSRSG